MCFLLQQSADGDAQTLTEVDLFISTQRIKVLNADSQVSLLLAEGLMPFNRDRWRALRPPMTSALTHGSSDDSRLFI